MTNNTDQTLDPRMARVLGLLYTTTQRFESVQGRYTGWINPAVTSKAMAAYLASAAERGSHTVLLYDDHASRSALGGPNRAIYHSSGRFQINRTDFVDGCPINPKGLFADSNGQPIWPHGDSPSYDLETMLVPWETISDSLFTILGKTNYHCRAAFNVQAVPRRQWHENADETIWNLDTSRLLTIDQLTGIILKAESWFHDEPHSRAAIEEPLIEASRKPAAHGSEHILDTALGLLYTAQHNFVTVQAAIHHWYKDRHWNRQIWAAAPDRLYEQWLTENGEIAQWSAFNRESWWRADTSGNRLATNSELIRVASRRADVAYRPPLTPADEYYGILDGHYAITAEAALNPSYLISGLHIENIGQSVHEGRPVLQVHARPTANAQRRWNWLNAQEYELLIDSERGALLYLSAQSAEETSMGHKVKWICYDDPLPDRIFNPTAHAGTEVSIHGTPTRR